LLIDLDPLHETLPRFETCDTRRLLWIAGEVMQNPMWSRRGGLNFGDHPQLHPYRVEYLRAFLPIWKFPLTVDVDAIRLVDKDGICNRTVEFVVAHR
jgi:hypothetical protein